MEEEITKLSDEEIDYMSNVLIDLVHGICDFADIFNYDRDDAFDYFAMRINQMADLCTIKDFHGGTLILKNEEGMLS